MLRTLHIHPHVTRDHKAQTDLISLTAYVYLEDADAVAWVTKIGGIEKDYSPDRDDFKDIWSEKVKDHPLSNHLVKVMRASITDINWD